jgi:hypothetical protein
MHESEAAHEGFLLGEAADAPIRQETDGPEKGTGESSSDEREELNADQETESASLEISDASAAQNETATREATNISHDESTGPTQQDSSRNVPSDDVIVAADEPPIYPQPVCGIWGKFQPRPPVDLKALYLLFESVELGEPPRKEIPTAESMASQITDSAFAQARRKGPRTSAAEPASTAIPSELERDELNETKSAKSANSEFVDGLDDIGKFFEDVEPPDELDVGAVGTSIQEVLMGQGSRIIIKRLQMGASFVRRTFLAVKARLAERFVDEDGNLTIVDPEKIEKAVNWVWTTSKRLYHQAQTVLDNLIERGIAGGLSREYEESDASPSSSPYQNDDVRELLRQYSRVGSGSTPKK